MLFAVSMSSTYLSMRASGAPPARALRFERGRPIAEFSLGAPAATSRAPAREGRPLWVSFDGQCLVVRRDADSPPATIDGRPLALAPQRITRVPCCIELGGTRWVVENQAAPASLLDSGSTRESPAIVPLLTLSVANEGLAPAGCGSRPAVAPTHFEPVAASFARVRSGVLVPVEGERTLPDGHATSVMPLEVMLQRGLVPKPQPRAPREPPSSGREPAHGRRRRAASARHEGPRGERWRARLSSAWQELASGRWVAVLQGWQGRWLVWGMALPMAPLLCYALSPGVSASSAHAGFEATAWAASESGRPAGARASTASRSSAGAAAPAGAAETAGAVKAAGELEAAGEADALHASRFIDASRAALPERVRSEAPRSDLELPASDARSGPTAERLAVDALAAGDEAKARALYAALAEREREQAAFSEAARILALRQGLLPASARSNALAPSSDDRSDPPGREETTLGDTMDGDTIHAR